MKNLLILIIVSLFMIPFAGSTKPKEKILHPPTHWIETPNAPGVYQGLYLDQYLTEVMNILIKTDNSTKVDMSIYISTKGNHITTQIECGETSHHIFRVMRMLLDSLPHFDPAVTVSLGSTNYRDTLYVGVQHYRDAPSEIYVVRKSKEGDYKNKIIADKPNNGVVLPAFQGGDMLKFHEWVTTNIPDHTISFHNSISQQVVVEFIVGTDGYIEPYTSISHKSEPLLTQEIFRVVRASPQWTPGYRDGKPIRVKYTMPIELVLK